jgi:mRNA interferase MazF
LTSSLRRGDIVPLRAPKRATGHEQRGQRYAVIVQSDDAEWLSTVLIAPTSTSALPTVFRPEIAIRGRKTLVLTDQLTTADRSRLGRTVGRLTFDQQRDIEEALKDILGLL